MNNEGMESPSLTAQLQVPPANSSTPQNDAGGGEEDEKSPLKESYRTLKVGVGTQTHSWTLGELQSVCAPTHLWGFAALSG